MPAAKRRRKSIVGIEAAIVLIAFVIIAAALAYVVVNTGFFASQKSKDTIMRGISEAASSLQLDGSVVAYVNGTKSGEKVVAANVTALVIPVKISVGREGVDVSNRSLVVTVWIIGNRSLYMPDIYNGTTVEANIAFDETNITATIEEIAKKSNRPVAYMAIANSDGDRLLESNEKGFLIIFLGSKYAAREYDIVKIEVKAPIGASLIVEREIPPGLEPNQLIDLR